MLEKTLIMLHSSKNLLAIAFLIKEAFGTVQVTSAHLI